MEKRRCTRSEIIDAIVADAAGLFGDKRDGEAPPITRRNFHSEMLRYGARALRARLSQLSHAELLGEAADAAAFRAELDALYEEGLQRLESGDREAAAQARRQRQAELGRRRGLHPAILAAARHFQAHGKSAKQAWDAIKETPFRTGGGWVIVVSGPKSDRLSQAMRAMAPRERDRPIKFNHWRQRYWPAAKPG
jgi:hypothetical protein